LLPRRGCLQRKIAEKRERREVLKKKKKSRTIGGGELYIKKISWLWGVVLIGKRSRKLRNRTEGRKGSGTLSGGGGECVKKKKEL